MTTNNLIRNIVKEAIEDRFGQPILSPMDKLLTKLPALDKAIKLLMTSKYRFFVKDIAIVSPKPTTYRVVLNNDYDFLLIYRGTDNYTAKVAGKKYDLGTSGEVVRASQSITDLLINGLKPQTEQQDTGGAPDGGGGGLGGGGGSLGGSDFDTGPSDGVFEPLDSDPSDEDNPLDSSDIGEDDLA